MSFRSGTMLISLDTLLKTRKQVLRSFMIHSIHPHDAPNRFDFPLWKDESLDYNDFSTPSNIPGTG